MQLYQITNLHHGLMMVGPSGSGKSTAWKVLLAALERYDGKEGVAHVIDPKAISKEDLYGSLDPNTREVCNTKPTLVIIKLHLSRCYPFLHSLFLVEPQFYIL